MLVGEDIGIGPPAEVEGHPRGQEIETRTGETGAALALEHRVKPGAQAVKIENVLGRIIELGWQQFGRRPIGGLHFLGQFDTKDFTAQILEPVAVSIGS